MKYQGKSKTLPKLILLQNVELLKLKKSVSILNILGKLNHFGLRVLAEPFNSEEDLTLEKTWKMDRCLCLRLLLRWADTNSRGFEPLTLLAGPAALTYWATQKADYLRKNRVFNRRWNFCKKNIFFSCIFIYWAIKQNLRAIDICL